MAKPMTTNAPDNCKCDMSEAEIIALAIAIADKIFEAGSESLNFGGPAKRIQFMGAHPATGKEWGMSGYNKDGLIANIAETLEAYCHTTTKPEEE
jgi:hypothetical protein